MNKNTFFLFALVGTLAFASCSRCKKCSYSYKINGVDTTRSILEECGNNADLKLYEENAKAEAARNNSQSEVTCETVN
jgi:hypothetical protein